MYPVRGAQSFETLIDTSNLVPAGVELGRRWLAALLLAPDHERATIVDSIERRMTQLYAPEGGREKDAESLTPREVRVKLPPKDRGGYLEQIIRTYEVREAKPDHAAQGQAEGRAEQAKAKRKKA